MAAMADSGDLEKKQQYLTETPVSSEDLHADADADADARPACFRSTVQEILFVLTTAMGVAMPGFLQGCTIVISSFVGKDLNMSTAEITWMTASSSLTAGSFLLFFGKVADMFGRRSMFIGSLFLFAVFALATGFSRNAITVDVLNAVMGLACASAIPACQGILGAIYDKPSKRKNYAFACFSAGNPLGFVFGTIFAGIATQLFGWRAAFWLLAIIFCALTILACFTVPTDDSEKLPLTVQSLKQFDVVGSALTIAGIGLFSSGLSLGSDAPQGWKTPYVIVFIILGVLLMVAFVLWELRYPYPIMPMNVWRDREFSMLMTVLTLGFLAFPPTTFFVSLYLQNVSGFSALETAVHLLPMAISGIIVNIIAGLVLHKVSNKLLMGIGAATYTLAFLLLALSRYGTSYWALFFPGMIIVVIGADLQFNVTNMYVISSLAKSQQSVAGSIFQTVTKLSITVGLGITTAIFNSVQNNPPTTGYYANDPAAPYAAAFWFGTAVSFISVLFVPFLRINTQGNHGA